MNNKGLRTRIRIGSLHKEGLDQGLRPSMLIDYNLVTEKCKKAGCKIDIKKLKITEM